MTGTKRMLWTLGLVFFVTLAQAFINAGGDVFNVDMLTAQTAINAAVGAVLALAINYVSPWIEQYGVNKVE